MRTSSLKILILSLWIVVMPALAAEDTESSGEVVIGEPEQTRIDEFRINGQLYMIRVTPKKGPSYYLVDSDGDGNLESHRNELSPNLLIPSWVLKRW